jgi:hypothetical protein
LSLEVAEMALSAQLKGLSTLFTKESDVLVSKAAQAWRNPLA